MGVARDISQDFKECVRSAAIKQGMDELPVALSLSPAAPWASCPLNLANLMRLSNSFIMPKVVKRSSFLNAAIETMKSINTLQNFVVTRQKDYTDRLRSTEQDRDSIEHEVGLFVKTCRERIDLLTASIGKEENVGHPRWFSGLTGSAGNADMVAHQHGVVLILSERLHSVTKLFDGLRAARFQEAIEKSMPRRRKGLASKKSSTWDDNQESFKGEVSAVQELKQDVLEEETHALQVELTNLLDTAQETERKMIEMSALNHLFSTHVLHQAQQIEMLYQQALDATENVEKGNKEIRKTIDRSSSSRTFLLLFLFVLPLALLFLHWTEDGKNQKNCKQGSFKDLSNKERDSQPSDKAKEPPPPPVGKTKEPPPVPPLRKIEVPPPPPPTGNRKRTIQSQKKEPSPVIGYETKEPQPLGTEKKTPQATSDSS
ncbi:hypothetical protein L7F22_040254 [Adiantum nelumboides]|nr:hypothetical protein [Adiantum nelumboides]